MPIYTLSDGRKANVGPENEQRFLNDFADLSPQIEQEEQEQENINFNEPPVVEDVKEKKELDTAPMDAETVSQDDMASSSETSFSEQLSNTREKEQSLYNERKNSFVNELKGDSVLAPEQDLSEEDDNFFEQNYHQEQVDLRVNQPEKFDEKSDNWFDMLTSSIQEEVARLTDGVIAPGVTVGDVAEEIYNQFAYRKVLPYGDVEVVEGEDGDLEYEWSTKKVSLNDYRKGMGRLFGDIMQFTEKGWDGTKGLDAIGEIKEKGAEISEQNFDALWAEAIEAQNSGVVPQSVQRFQSIIEIESKETNRGFGFIKAIIDQPTVALPFLGNILAMQVGASVNSEKVRDNAKKGMIATGMMQGTLEAGLTSATVVGAPAAPAAFLSGFTKGSINGWMATSSATLANYNIYSQILQEELADAYSDGRVSSGDMTYENYITIVSDEEVLENMRLKAKLYGASIGIVDLITGYTVGKVIPKVATKPKQVASTVVFGGTGGGVGEFSAQTISGGTSIQKGEVKFNLDDAYNSIRMDEVMMEMVFGPLMEAPNAISAVLFTPTITLDGDKMTMAQIQKYIKKSFESGDGIRKLATEWNAMLENNDFDGLPPKAIQELTDAITLKHAETLVDASITNPDLRLKVAKLELEIARLKISDKESDKIILEQKKAELKDLLQNKEQYGFDQATYEQQLETQVDYLKQPFRRSAEIAQKMALEIDTDLLYAETTAEYLGLRQALLEQGATSDETGTKPIIADDLDPGQVIYIDGKRIALVNIEAAAKKNAIGVEFHELFHVVLDLLGFTTEELTAMTTDFVNALSDSDRDMLIKELDDRKYLDEDGNLKDSEQEWLAVFFDLVYTGKIKQETLSDSTWRDVANRYFPKVFGKAGFELAKFETGAEAYQFIFDYIAAVNAGTFKGKGFSIPKVSKPSVQSDKEKKFRTDKRSKEQVEEDVNDIVFGLDQETYFNEFDDIYKTIIERGDFDNLISANDKISKTQAQKKQFIKDVLTNMTGYIRNFDPTANTNFFAYINSQIKNRSALVANRRLKEIELEQKSLSLDDEGVFIDDIADETTTTTVEAEEAPSLVANTKISNNIKTRTLEIIRGAIIKLGVNFDEGKTKTKTVSPFISDFKKEVGDAPGGKKGISTFAAEIRNEINKDPEAYLRENMFGILRNAPLSWLEKNFPSMVFKSVNGALTLDWKGKKIDREKSAETGNTAGPQIKQRNNKITIDDQEFLDHFMPRDSKGVRKKKQMRFESIVKMLAQEYSLETLATELENDNSEISQLVDDISGLRDVVLAENYASEFKKDIERGNTKKYRGYSDASTIGRNAIDIVGLARKHGYRSSQFDDAIANLGIDPDSETLTKFMDYLDWFHDRPTKFKTPLKLEYVNNNFPYFAKQLKTYFATNISSDKSKKQLVKFNTKLLSYFPSKLLNGLNGAKQVFDLVGSRRILQGGKNGPKYQYDLSLKVDARKKANLPGKIDIDFEVSKLKLVNAGKGIALKIEKFLQQEFDTVQEKQAAFDAEFGDTIKEINENNHGFIKFNVKAMVDLVAKDPNNLVGVLRHLEASTNNTSGFLRAYTNISLVQIFAQDQTPSTKHPLYKEAIKYVNKYNPKLDAEGKKKRALELLRVKGEHVIASANMELELAKIIMKYGELIAQNPNDKKLIQAELDVELNNALDGYDQVLGAEVLFSNIDKRPGGTTDPGAYTRFDDVKKYLPTYHNPIDKTDGAVTQDNKINKKIQLALTDIKDRIAQTKKYRAASNPQSSGVTILDFDDTVAESASQVIVNKPDGTQYLIDAATFAKQGQDLLLQGNTFDFSQFNQVIDGKPGPFFKKLKDRIAKYGNEDVYILTARPAEAAPAIFEWLKSQGIELKRENITGLANSTPESKALWTTDLITEKGYQNVYFADDAEANVQVMDYVLTQIEGINSNVVLAEKKYRSKKFNKILEESSGYRANLTFSEVVGRQKGKKKDSIRVLPYSADDFEGLIYQFLGKGEQGEKHLQWFKQTLLDPFARGTDYMNREKQAIMTDYRALRKAMPEVRKKLGKKVPGTEFTYGTCIRVWLWDKAGYDMTNLGLSKRDLTTIKKVVNTSPDLITFANGLGALSRRDAGYIKPEETWIAGTIASDLENITTKINRKKFLEDFLRNKEEIFTDENINKLRAIYGNKFVEALLDSLYRMENGTNRPFGSSRIVNRWNNWVNNSVGAIMFFNARSAVLQTLSTVNFVNWSDNNPLKAAQAFADQPQYWKDFSFLFNSDFLKQRRAGLKTDVNQAELASAVSNSNNKAKATLAYLLKIGFTPTQVADSFAIASGGATLYRNKIKKYIKEGMSQSEAEKQAFIDFQEVAEKTQQSARPDKISQQQASALGRWVLAFQNTPMQYTRLMYRAGQDLAAGRGNKLENISKIIYYGAIQNLIFSSLQSALFAFAFDDELDEKEQEKLEQKQVRIVNNMIDSILRGTGVTGAAVATIKNTVMEFFKQEEKQFNNDHAQTLIQIANLSPPVGIKFRKIYSGIQSYTYNKKVIPYMLEENPTDIKNPAYQAVANVISGATNFPVDRVLNKVNNLVEVMDSQNESWQRVALTLGWNTWDVGIEKTEVTEAQEAVKKKKAEEKKKTQQRCTKIKSDGERCKIMVDKPKKRCHYHD